MKRRKTEIKKKRNINDIYHYRYWNLNNKLKKTKKDLRTLKII